MREMRGWQVLDRTRIQALAQQLIEEEKQQAASSSGSDGEGEGAGREQDRQAVLLRGWGHAGVFGGSRALRDGACHHAVQVRVAHSGVPVMPCAPQSMLDVHRAC